MYADDVTVNTENPKQRTGNSKRFSKVTEHTTNINKLNCISVHQQKMVRNNFKNTIYDNMGNTQKKSDYVTIKYM